MIYKEEAEGITQLSLKYFRRHRNRIGEILGVQMLQYYLEEEAEWEPWSMRIKGTKGEIWLSGCNSGYGGEGPHGSVTVLRELGYQEPYCLWPFSKNAFVLGPPGREAKNEKSRSGIEEKASI